MNKKKLLLNILKGFFIPFLLFLVLVLLSLNKGEPKARMQLLAVGIITSSIIGFKPIYDYDVWSVKKKIFIHSICMMLTLYPALIISTWYDTTKVSGYIIALASFILFGLVAATIGYLVSKHVLKNVPK